MWAFSRLQKIPPMDEILSRLNSTLLNITIVTNDTKKAVNDTFNSGVQEIEFFKYSTEVWPTILETGGSKCVDGTRYRYYIYWLKNSVSVCIQKLRLWKTEASRILWRLNYIFDKNGNRGFFTIASHGSDISSNLLLPTTYQLWQ